MPESVTAGPLSIAYQETGRPQGWPVILLHGFPYDVHAYAEVAAVLAAAGARVIVPWLRGFGPTRFLDAQTPRSGQQAALGQDLLNLLDALAIPSAILAGHDWGGRAACIVAALWPQRVRGLVSQNGYTIQNIARAAEPLPPEAEQRLWYQYYFHSERGRAGLAQNRGELCRLLWRLWSPEWPFDTETFECSAQSFENPEFVEIVVHSYRHRFGIVAGDPALAHIEQRLAAQPPIAVPSITLDGDADGVIAAGDAGSHAAHFTRPREHRIVPHGGHNLPQEMPDVFARAVLDLHKEVFLF